jgi:hypothetical protein
MSTDNVNDKIAKRAYELYIARGGKGGSDMEDWLRAEREIKSALAKSVSVNAAPAVAPKVVGTTKTSTAKKAAAPVLVSKKK